MSPVQEVVPRGTRRFIARHAPEPVLSVLREAVDRENRAYRSRSRRRRERMRRRVVERDGPSWTVVTYAGRQFQARAVDRYRSDEGAAENLALVADTLEAADIRYAVLSPSGLDRQVVVGSADRQHVLAALRGRTDRHIHLVLGRKSRRPRPVADVPHSARATTLGVFEFLGTADGRLLAGPEIACKVEFWDVVTEPDMDRYGESLVPGALRAPRINGLAAALGPLDRCPREEVDGRERPVAGVGARPHLFRATFPIDVVYTWVDGSDPAWARRKQRRLAELHPSAVCAEGSAPCRYASHDELRYSLRSLAMFAPWVRKVFLVTDDQVPWWLDTCDPRIEVVSHRQLFTDPSVLPTFNSQAIEAQLHRIPGLSEHFLYLNDDFFFGRPVEPELFFLSNGMTRFFPSTVKIGGQPVSPADSPVMAAAKNNRDLLLATFGAVVTARFKHAPYALRVSVLRDMESIFAEVFERTTASPFRSPTDVAVASSLHHYYAYATGRGVPGSLAYTYVDLGVPNVERLLDRLLAERAHDTFCVNETESAAVDPASAQRLLGDFMREYFPLPSRFEIEVSDHVVNRLEVTRPVQSSNLRKRATAESSW